MRVLGGSTAVLLTAIVASFFSAHARAEGPTSEICQPRDDRQEAAAIQAYFTQNLKGHEQQGFSRALSGSVKAKAKAFLEQRILDKKAELCADRLKLVEDIKTTPSRVTGSTDCVNAMIVSLMDAYTKKTATTYDQNSRALGALRDEHLREVKRKLFDIAKGSTNGVDVSIARARQGAKFEWIKNEASKLAGEARTVWGEAKANVNPLVQKNLVIAREAMRAKKERDAMKARLHTDGKLPPGCKWK